jgi:hypothetical protein
MTTCFYVIVLHPHNARGFKIVGVGYQYTEYPTDGEIRHLTHLLKPHCRALVKPTCQRRRRCVSRSRPKANLYPARALWKGLGQDRRLRQQISARLSPMMSSKCPTPVPCRERLSPRPTLLAYFCLARGTHGALWQGGDPWGLSLWHPFPPMGRTWSCKVNRSMGTAL